MFPTSNIDRRALQGLVVAVFATVALCGSGAAGDSAGVQIEAPAFALDGVPVSAVRIEVRDADGNRVSASPGDVRIDGVDVVTAEIVTSEEDVDDAATGPSWEQGVLRLETNLSIGRKVFITADRIRVTLPDGRTAERAVRRLPGWLSLVPALVAVGLAVALRETLVALFVAVWSGVSMLQGADGGWWSRFSGSFVETVDTTLVGQLVPADGSTTHVQIILFTLFLGCLIGVMSASGGTEALVEKLTPVTRTRRGGQVTTWFLGLVVFFDDYANSLLLGSTMRPVTDRLQISREKLAFLVDATAAPIAGLALVSTWVGFEVGLIGDSFVRLAETNPTAAFSGDAYGTFLATLPYRFYPLLLLAFVLMIAWTGRDFGPMWRAERQALGSERPPESPAKPQALIGGDREANAETRRAETGRAETGRAETGRAETGGHERPAGTWRVANAVVPLGVLLGGIVVGFWVTGRAGTDDASPSLWQIISHAESNRVLLVASFLASMTAVMTSIVTRSLSLGAAVAAWLDGARSMLLGTAVLVLAWSVAMVCDADHLNTAGYLVEMTTGRLDIAWMPAVAFLLSAAVSFATGSSWATMGLLIPLVISVTYGLIAGDSSLLAGIDADRHPLMLASIGGVLAGAIFGDHCSPISDTTVLSSVAADCDHLAHVMTQLPYAVCVGLVALAIGCVPAGFGMSWIVSLPLGMVGLWGLVRLVGRPIDG